MSLATLYQQRRARRPSPANWGDQGSIAADQGRTAAAAGAMGGAATADYYNRISSFDPTQAINRYAQGAWSQLKTGFDKNLQSLKGQAVGGGRLDTGFYDEDVGELYRGTVQDFSDDLARQSVAATGMEMQNNRMIGEFGDTQTERNLDLGVARREELINDAREKAERKRKNKRGIIGFLGGAAGGIIGGLTGGVPGAFAGYQIGKGLGGGG